MAVSLTNLLLPAHPSPPPPPHQLSSVHEDTSPHSDVAFWYQKGKYRPCFQRIVVMCVDLSSESLRNQFRSLSNSKFSQVALSKAFKDRYISWSHLEQRITDRASGRQTKQPGNKEAEEGYTWASKSFIWRHLEVYP